MSSVKEWELLHEARGQWTQILLQTSRKLPSLRPFPTVAEQIPQHTEMGWSQPNCEQS